jgi:hypothetical protein
MPLFQGVTVVVLMEKMTVGVEINGTFTYSAVAENAYMCTCTPQ